MKKRLLILSIFLAVFLITPIVVQAEESCNPGAILPPCVCSEGVPGATGCGLRDFFDLFINLYAFGLHIAAPLAVLYSIIGSVVLITASGYQNRITMGKTMITQAVTGLVIVLLSWIIIDTTVFVITGDRTLTITGKPWFGGLTTYTCKDAELRQGCSGDNVTTLQTSLTRLGYSLTINGEFDVETRERVIAFQSDVINHVYVLQGRSACDRSDPAIAVWERAFDKSLGDCSIGGNCSVFPQDILARAPKEPNGIVDENTQSSILKLISTQFSSACRTQS